MDDGRLSIGRFARLSGLSIHALRHYDELGLLRTASLPTNTVAATCSPGTVPTWRHARHGKSS